MLVLLASLFCLQALLLPLPARATPPSAVRRATITFADGSSIALRARDRFRAIPLSAGELITIDAQLPAQMGNAPAFAQPLDGGEASEVVIAANGTTSFTFQVGNQPGLYRLFLGAFGRTATLEFEVPAAAAL